MRQYNKSLMVGCAIAASIAFGSAGHAATFPFTFTGNTTAGDAVDVSASVTPGTNSLTVVVTNLTVNPKTVAQNISDFTVFVAGTPITGVGATSTPTANYVLVDGSGNASAASAPANTAWSVTSTPNSVHVNDLGTPCGPACTILGAPGPGGVYTNANGSIAANGPHNPFINQTATFILSVTGITAATQIINFQWSFGTAPGNVSTNQVPLPPAALLFGTALVGLGVLGRRRRQEKLAA
jgi:hypothetical protein